jgi:hypothetical protein
MAFWRVSVAWRRRLLIILFRFFIADFATGRIETETRNYDPVWV